MDKLLYRPKEAASVLGISRDKLYDVMRAGRITSVKDGRARFITADAPAAYVVRLEAEAAEVRDGRAARQGKLVEEQEPACKVPYRPAPSVLSWV
jgi:excisionase family DNA binding protein